jgi:hypothetical protein
MASPEEILGKYREKDDKTPQGEAIPEKETLNTERMRQYLVDKKFTPDNFDKLFTVDSAIGLLKAGGTRGEQEMIKAINDSLGYLSKIGLKELMEDSNKTTFHSTLLKELIKRNEQNMETVVMQGYETYALVRERARKLLLIQQKGSERREKEKVTTEKSLTQSFKDIIGDVKKNFGKMDGTEQLVTVGGLLVGAVMLLTSKNEKIEKFKNSLWTMLKVGGLGLTANYAVKLFTGKTAIDTATDWSKDNLATDEFWMNTYKTDGEKAALVQKSIVYLGDKDFMQVAKAYKDAKAANKTEVSIPGVLDKHMSPSDIYLALDTFFKSYPVDTLELKYRNAKRRPNWDSVVAAAMVEDSSIELSGNVVERAYDDVREYGIRGWNGFWVTTEGTGLMKSLYLKAWGKEPGEGEMKELTGKLRSQLENEVTGEAELGAFLDRHMSETSSKQYKQLMASGQRDNSHPQVKFLEVSGDSMYVMSEAKLDASMASEKAVGDMLGGALKDAEAFLKGRYPEAAANLYKFVNIEEVRGVRVTDSSTFKLFMRMPLKGSPEYSRKTVMATPPTERKEKPGVEIFGVNDKIEYGRLESFDKERLRVLFLLDVSQKAELDVVCKWYTDFYKTKSLPKNEVMKALFEDEDARKKAVEELNLKQGLKGAADLMHTYEGKLADIEKDAAAAFDTTVLDKLYPPNWFGKVSDAFEPLVTYMRRSVGYKIQLAILGDKEARVYWSNIDPKKYSPEQNPDWIDAIMKDYEKECKRFVKEFEADRVRFNKP